MSMREIVKNSTDQSVVIRIIDSSTGLPETAVEHDTAGIDLWYRREGATKTSIVEAALASLDAAHSDGGIEHIGDGYYRLDLPDAAVATGANGVMVGGAVTGMVVIGCYIPLVNFNPYDSVRAGLTALPNAVPGEAGGVFIAGANAATTLASAAVTGALTIGDGIAVTCTTGDKSAIVATGNGTGHGLFLTGGTTSGNALTAIGGAPNGQAVYTHGTGSGAGFRADGGATGHGIYGVGAGNGHGIVATGDGTGHGIHAGGGATGHGINAAGGGTSGDGIHAAATTSGDGIECVGAGAGLDLKADEIADIPTVAEFEARTLASADYVVTTDTIAGVTLCGTCTTNTDMRGTNSAALASVCTEARLSELDAGTGGKMANQMDIVQTDTTTDIPTTLTAHGLSIANVAADVAAILTDTGTTLDTYIKQLLTALVYKMKITEASGNTEQFNAANESLGTINAAFTTDGTYTVRLKMVI